MSELLSSTPDPPVAPKPRSGILPFLLGFAAVLVGMIGWSFTVDRPSAETARTAASVASVSPGPRFAAIQDIRLGQRVQTGITDAERYEAVGPQADLPWWDRRDTVIERAGWRQVSMSVENRDGAMVEVHLLRPLEWFWQANATPSGTIELSMPELGVEGPASIDSVSSCPPIESGSGRVVTGRFIHRRDGVVWMKLKDVGKPIGITDTHHVYSADRKAFIPAGELHVGETLKLKNRLTTIQSLQADNKAREVFNLEVQGEHVSRVTQRGLLVHNNCGSKSRISDDDGKLFRGIPRNASEKSRLGFQGIAKPRGTRTDQDALRKHVLSEDIDAGVTSWTSSRDQAKRFSGSDGIILEVNLADVSKRVIKRPNVGKYEEELEILLEGIVQGAATDP